MNMKIGMLVTVVAIGIGCADTSSGGARAMIKPAALDEKAAAIDSSLKSESADCSAAALSGTKPIVAALCRSR